MFTLKLPFWSSTGRGGQKFIERCVPKVSELRARFPDKDIEVDGGVGPKTVGACADAGTLHTLLFSLTLGSFSSACVFSCFNPGSNVIVAGTAIFGADDPNAVITTLKSTVNEAQEKIAQARA